MKKPIGPKRSPRGPVQTRSKTPRGRFREVGGGDWLCGLVDVPPVRDADGNLQPAKALIWARASGQVLSAQVLPEVDVESVEAAFSEAIEEPMNGRPGWPKRLLVGQPELAEMLQVACGDRVSIVVGPVPMLDVIGREFAGFLAERAAAGGVSILGTGVESARMGSFFTAAAELYRRQPWGIVPSDADVIEVRLPELDNEELVVSIIGQNRQAYGFLVFPNYDVYEDYLDMAERATPDAPPEPLVGMMALNFERLADIEPELKALAQAGAWALAGPMAFPWPLVIGDDQVPRSPDAQELSLLEAITLALVGYLGNQAQFQSAMRDGPPYVAKQRVFVAEQWFTVELEFPHPVEQESPAA